MDEEQEVVRDENVEGATSDKGEEPAPAQVEPTAPSPDEQPAESDLQVKWAKAVEARTTEIRQLQQQLRTERIEQARQLPAEEQAVAVEQVYQEELATTRRERDILRASAEYGISEEDLEGATNPQHLEQLVDLAVKKREMAKTFERKETRLRKELEDKMDGLVDTAYRRFKKDAGMDDVATSPGTSPLSDTDQLTKKRQEHTDSLAGTGDLHGFLLGPEEK